MLFPEATPIGPRIWWFYWEDYQGSKWEYGPYIYEDARDQKEYYEKMHPERTYYLEQRYPTEKREEQS